MTLPPVADRDPYNDAHWETPLTQGRTADRVTQRNLEIKDRKDRIATAKETGQDPGQSEMIASEAKQYSGAPQAQEGVRDETGLITAEQTKSTGTKIVKFNVAEGSGVSGSDIDTFMAQQGITVIDVWMEGNQRVYKIPSNYNVSAVKEYATDYAKSEPPKPVVVEEPINTGLVETYVDTGKTVKVSMGGKVVEKPNIYKEGGYFYKEEGKKVTIPKQVDTSSYKPSPQETINPEVYEKQKKEEAERVYSSKYGILEEYEKSVTILVTEKAGISNWSTIQPVSEGLSQARAQSFTYGVVEGIVSLPAIIATTPQFIYDVVTQPQVTIPSIAEQIVTPRGAGQLVGMTVVMGAIKSPKVKTTEKGITTEKVKFVTDESIPKQRIITDYDIKTFYQDFVRAGEEIKKQKTLEKTIAKTEAQKLKELRKEAAKEIKYERALKEVATGKEDVWGISEGEKTLKIIQKESQKNMFEELTKKGSAKIQEEIMREKQLERRQKRILADERTGLKLQARQEKINLYQRTREMMVEQKKQKIRKQLMKKHGGYIEYKEPIKIKRTIEERTKQRLIEREKVIEERGRGQLLKLEQRQKVKPIQIQKQAVKQRQRLIRTQKLEQIPKQRMIVIPKYEQEIRQKKAIIPRTIQKTIQREEQKPIIISEQIFMPKQIQEPVSLQKEFQEPKLTQVLTPKIKQELIPTPTQRQIPIPQQIIKPIQRTTQIPETPIRPPLKSNIWNQPRTIRKKEKPPALSRRFDYAPSLVGIARGIRIKSPPKKMSGLGIRGVIEPGGQSMAKKKKRKKKR